MMMPWTVTLHAKGLSTTRQVEYLGRELLHTTEEVNGQRTTHYFRLISIDKAARTAVAVFDRSRVSRRGRRAAA